MFQEAVLRDTVTVKEFKNAWVSTGSDVICEWSSKKEIPKGNLVLETPCNGDGSFFRENVITS